MKDYARKNNDRNRVKPKKKSRRRISVVVVALGICIPLAMFLVRIIHSHSDDGNIVQSQPVKITQTSEKPKMTGVAAKHHEAEFDFYTLLPNMKVTNGNNASTKNKSKQATFVLEVATFLQSSDAQHLKTQLGLMGFNAFVQDYRVDHSVRYRVFVGPYNHFSNARVDQKRLRQQHLSSILRRLRTNS